MLKVLFWKEWRESRLLFLLGILFIVAVFFLDFFFSRSTLFMLALPALTFYTPLVGASAFSKEDGKLTFLLSKPVRKLTIMTVKLVNGLLNILIMYITGSVVMWIIITYKRDHTHIFYQQNIVNVIPTFSLYYIISFFMSSLFLSAPTSFMIGIFGGTFISGGLQIYLYKCGYSQFYPVLIFNVLFFFLSLSYLIFTRREVRC